MLTHGSQRETVKPARLKIVHMVLDGGHATITDKAPYPCYPWFRGYIVNVREVPFVSTRFRWLTVTFINLTLLSALT